MAVGGRESYVEEPQLFIKKGTWTPDEDALLLAFVKQHGAAAWSTAQYFFPELCRTGKSCRLRYLNHLQPGICRGSVSREEARLILQAYSVLGNQWSKIASLIPGRTDNTVKNVVNMHLKKARRRAVQMLHGLNVVSGTAGRAGGHISAPDVQMPAPITSLYPPAWGQTSVDSINWPAALQQGHGPSVQISFQGLPMCPELPSVQHLSNSLGGYATAQEMGAAQQQETFFGSDLAAMAATVGSFNMKPAAAGDKDLMEAVYSVSHGTSTNNTLSSGSVFSANAASDDASMMLPMEYSNALFDGRGMMDLGNVLWGALPDLEGASF